MAVEARHLGPFPPQIYSNSDVMVNGSKTMNNIYNSGMMYGGISPAGETMFQPLMAKNDAHHLPGVSRKRSREDSVNSIKMNQLVTYPIALRDNPNISGGEDRSSAGQFMFLGENFATQIQGQQLEVDRFFAHHTEKVRLEIEERRKRYSKRIIAAVEEEISKRLKAKEDELQSIVKFNQALEERTKSLCYENQIWRDLAQTNEGAANILRTNLEQMLAQVQHNPHQNFEGAAEQLGDVQSSCRSNDDQEPETRYDHAGKCNNQGGIALCRLCGKKEACVLLLPCRHLCLCSVCGSSQNICPVCLSPNNCSFHLNFDS